jgi:hypothetical protein
MTIKTFLTISAALGIIYGLTFVLMPANSLAIYGAPPQPNAILNFQFFGSALLSIGLVLWFAKDFRDWEAVRKILIAVLVGYVVGLVINLRGTFLGLSNAMSWSSTIVYALLIAGAVYFISTGSRNTV